MTPRNYARLRLLAAALLLLAGIALADTATHRRSPEAPQSSFTVGLKPAAVTIAQGRSKSVTVTTDVQPGYSHDLQLSAASLPSGVTVTFTPPDIPAPGAGKAKAHITVGSGVAPGIFILKVKASDGQTTHSATLTLTVTASGPGATFQGCWYKKSGHGYQGVHITVANPGTYPFDAVLYYGAGCNTNRWADEFGFGNPVEFGDFEWTFWFTDFADQTNMSALWFVGSDQSQCMNYATAPDC